MKIVVLDGHTLNPDDLSWEPLGKFGDLEVFPRTRPSDVLSRAREANILLVNKVRLNRETLDQLPELKYVGLLATGFDNVDAKAAAEKEIVVTNVPSYGTPSVAQHTLALLLELTNRVGLHNKSVQELEWERNEDFSYFKQPLVELHGKTVGIIGYGSIGKEVAGLCQAFGMNVTIHSQHTESVDIGKWVPLEELLINSDVISIHSALTSENKGLINAEALRKMKSSCFLINTSRGAIINEQDLADALNTNQIAGAALDVLSTEPPPPEHPLTNVSNCIITPHISWVTKEARQRLMDIAVANIEAFLEGNSLNRVN